MKVARRTLATVLIIIMIFSAGQAAEIMPEQTYEMALNCLKSYLSFGSEEESSDLTKAIEFFSTLDKYKFSSGMEQYAQVLQKLNELSMLNMDTENATELENKLKEEINAFLMVLAWNPQLNEWLSSEENVYLIPNVEQLTAYVNGRLFERANDMTKAVEEYLKCTNCFDVIDRLLVATDTYYPQMYQQACGYAAAGDYENALALFSQLAAANYEDSASKVTALQILVAEENATPEPTATPMPVYADLVQGNRGDAVLNIQRRLDELGYFSDTLDGIYGAYTTKVIRVFQANAGLSVTGNADNATQQRLFAGDAPRAGSVVVKDVPVTPKPATAKPKTTTPKPEVTTPIPEKTTSRPNDVTPPPTPTPTPAPQWSSWSDWSKTSVSSSSTREVQTEVRREQTGTKTTYEYNRYLYKDPSLSYWTASYGENWANSKGFKGSWQYASSSTRWPVDHTTDGRNVYSGEKRDGNRWWYNESVKTEPIYGDVTYYRYRDRVN